MARSYPSRKSVAPLRKRIWVYPDSDDEDEEYYSLPPLLICFQTPQSCATINSVHHNSHSKVDTENMTLEEYARYESAMSTMKSKIHVPTHGLTSQFFNQIQHTPNPYLDKKDSGLEKIWDDLFRIWAENINVEHEVPNSIAEEKEEARMEDVEMDENQDIDHTGDRTRGLHDSFNMVTWFLKYSSFLAAIQVEVCGVMLGRNLATENHFKTGLVRYHVDDDDGMICDDGCCSRKQTWSMA
nr:hypothetical protein [Tanacetum cinerariifolium]